MNADNFGLALTVAGLLTLFSAAFVYWRNGTLKAAVQTISILQSQLEAVQMDRAELGERVKALETETRVLRELVTNAAHVEEFAARVEAMHQIRANEYEAIDHKLTLILEARNV